MILLNTLLAVLAPLSMFVVPGLAWLPQWHQESPANLWARIGIVSIVATILVSLSAALVGVPQGFVIPLLLLITAIALVWQRQHLTKITTWYLIMWPPVLLLVLVLLFSIPATLFHDGLPSGDIQKSIVWANDVIASHHLPNYERAIADYNRDPVDFYTPGLHTALAATGQPEKTASLFSIIFAVAAAGIGIALARNLFPYLPAWPLMTGTGILILTNLRWLRYLREPGYHVQNSVGEFLLFGLVFLLVGLLRKWDWLNVTAAALTIVALALTHQFSAFIAAFAVLPFIVAVTISYIHTHQSWRQLTLPGLAVFFVVGLGLALGLHHKLMDIFSATPHLLNLTPSLGDYFSLMGTVWFALGLAGLVVLIIHTRTNSPSALAFIALTIIVLLLSQGPRLLIDIPPVRALFYAVIPLSITGAYLISLCWQRRHMGSIRLLTLILLTIVAFGSYASLARAYQLSHTVRTNSTLLPEQQYLIEHLAQDSRAGGVLIDDYNRRSASWLILAHRPTFTRIAADLAVQMAEATQSPLRYQLYLNQLDYEKIFSLGSKPAVAELLAKHGISFITGITGSSNMAFAHNPTLTSSASGGDITVYKLTSHNSLPTDNWLLRASTLANDIGDDEDTFEHLPASLRAGRVSEPLVTAGTTFRTTDSKIIPLRFNVGNYVAALWNQDQRQRPDIDLEFLVDFATTPASPLTVRTPVGSTYHVPTNGVLLRLPAAEVPFDEQGFITITLENPAGELVSLDLIALGLAQVP